VQENIDIPKLPSHSGGILSSNSHSNGNMQFGSTSDTFNHSKNSC